MPSAPTHRPLLAIALRLMAAVLIAAMLADFSTMRAIGIAAALIAALAWWGDRRRIRRRNLDAVGWMPWTPVFFVALMVAVIELGLAAKAWVAG